MASIVLVVVLLILNILNTLLHILGIYLLICVIRNGTETAEKLYLINLSTCEALMNFLEASRRITSLIPLSPGANKIIDEINQYVLIVMFTGISFVFYLDMIYLTFDKLLDIVLNIKYHLYWDVFKAKRLIKGTWVIGVSLSITIALLYRFTNYDWEGAFFKCFYPTLEFGFIVLAFVTYSFIFYKYKETRRAPLIAGTRYQQKKESYFRIFRRSRFYISVLIILNFLVFMVIPDLIYLFVGIIYGHATETLSISCWISYAVSNLLDLWIYTFLQVSVRKLLLRKLKIRS